MVFWDLGLLTLLLHYLELFPMFSPQQLSSVALSHDLSLMLMDFQCHTNEGDERSVTSNVWSKFFSIYFGLSACCPYRKFWCTSLSCLYWPIFMFKTCSWISVWPYCKVSDCKSVKLLLLSLVLWDWLSCHIFHMQVLGCLIFVSADCISCQWLCLAYFACCYGQCLPNFVCLPV